MNPIVKIVVNLRLTAAALDAEAVKLRETADLIESSIPVEGRIVPVDFGSATKLGPKTDITPDNTTYGS